MQDLVPIMIACNKQDMMFARKSTTIENELAKNM
jgi:hypothetical protein